MAEALAVIGGTAAILELSKVTCSVAQTLYAFCRNTKHVNENIKELAAEVNSLGNTCAVVHNLLCSLEKEYGTKEEERDEQYISLWECVGEQVQDCKRTIGTLEKSLEGIQKDGRGFLAQASRQIKLSLMKDGIAEIRSRVKLHMSCLQVTLQSVNIVVSNLAPKRADHELLDKIAALSKDVKDLKKQQKEETQQVDNSFRRSSTAALRLSQEIIISGRKLYRESIRSGTITRSYTDATLVELAEVNSKDGGHASSETGKDEEFAFEIADATAEAAQAAFEREDWTSTIAYIEELTRGLKRGSFRLSPAPAVDSFDLIHMHAISTFHTDEPSTAKLRLIQAVEQHAATDARRKKLYYAQHCLAMSEVRLANLENANDTCKSALESRRRLMGREHDSYLESLALMSRIHELQGNQFRAQIYLTMIPESRVDILKAKYQPLTFPGAGDNRHDSLPIIPLVSNDVAGLGILGLRLTGPEQEIELPGPSKAGAEEFEVERTDSLDPDRSLRLPANRDDWSWMAGVSSPSKGGTSPLLPSPPSTAIPDFGRKYQASWHRRNQSAPLGSKTVPGSPLLPSPRALEPSSPPSRPLGTTGLFRGVSTRTRRAWLTSLNFRPSDDVEKAVCKGDLMALHAALNKIPSQHPPSTTGNIESGRSRGLHLAALFGDVRMAHALIINGADIHSTTPKTFPPGRFLFVPNALSESETALHFAIGSRQAPMVEFLLGQGASLYDIRFSLDLPTANLLDVAWLRATQCGSAQEIVDVLQVLVNTGWDVNRPLRLRGSDQDSLVFKLIRTPHWPFDDRPVLSFCLDSGFDIKQRATDGKTIVEIATALNDTEALEMLVRSNLDAERSKPMQHERYP